MKPDQSRLAKGIPVAPCLIAMLLAACATPSESPLTETTPVADDPYIWLEETYDPQALAWAREENARTFARLEADPRYHKAYTDAFAIASARDRIAWPAFRNGEIYNFWTDAENLRGIWRRTSLDEYRSDKPQWTTILDFDALGAAEGRSWVYKGVDCLAPEERLCLVSLSDGGEDAVEMREFDLARGAFVDDGFFVPKGKSGAAWESENHLLVSFDFAQDGSDLTESGYPVVVKRVSRGKPLAEAEEIYRGQKDDVAVDAMVLRDTSGHGLTLIRRALDFFRTEYLVPTAQGLTKLALPEKATAEALIDNRLIVRLSENWAVDGRTFEAGAIVSLDGDAIRANPERLRPVLVWSPGPTEAFEALATTKDRLLIAGLDNVRGRIWTFAPQADGTWAKSSIDMPDNLALNLISADRDSNRFFLSAEGFTTPSTLYLGDAESGATDVVKRQPTQFDAHGLVVEQRWAASSDGTRIPYFLVHRQDAPMDGSTPTLLYGYGGFMVSMTPGYGAITGRLWLEKGGAYALANIRGGGEFGPAWHAAGLQTKRQIVFDDFAAVGEDLIASGFTSPERLGIMGGSNGGLLVGVEMIQRPDLWNAAVIQIPLLDMIRIARIGAGASWQGEYGNVDADAEVMAFWRDLSPYHTLDPGADYPEPLIYTSTKDDRTGAAHGRKFAARMQELGLPYLYYENVEGGHAAGADPKQSARMWALTYTYLMQRLMPPE